MLEKDVEQLLVREIKVAGGRAFKFVSPGNAGVPDRMVCLPGGDISFVELKTDEGRLTKLQEKQIRRLRNLGQEVYVAYGVRGVVNFLRAKGLDEQAGRLKKHYDL